MQGGDCMPINTVIRKCWTGAADTTTCIESVFVGSFKASFGAVHSLHVACLLTSTHVIVRHNNNVSNWSD
jgi:hypothetical protein